MTFRWLVAMAARRDCLAHAFDSFVGMPEPGEFDSAHYPKGTFDVGGKEGFRKLMDEHGADPAYYRLWPGWIPACFIGADALQFAFVFVDVDVYEPTLAALAWAWPRLAPGGILLADDYFPGSKIMAGRALTEWLPQPGPDATVLQIENSQLLIRKER